MLLGSPLLRFWLVSLLMDAKPTEAAGVWALRSQLKPHFSDSLSGASADSDFFLLLQALRALFNAAGFSAEFMAQGDVADLDLPRSISRALRRLLLCSPRPTS